MRPRPVLVLLLLVLLTVPPAASAARTLRAGRYGLSALGAFHPGRDPSLGRAIGVFGSPTRRSGGGSGCAVSWRRLRLRIVFANFGGGDACSPRYGKAQSVVIGRSKRWRTAHGLHVGNRVGQITRRHPRAERHGSRWWLAVARSPFGEGGRYAVLAARTAGGRVSGFSGWIGAAGE